MKTLRLLMPVLAVGVLAGCRSRVVEVKLVNASPQPLSTIIVDYPSATFGVDKLNPDATYQYPIKPLATGPSKSSSLTHTVTTILLLVRHCIRMTRVRSP
ncbi:MAG TPA: hypothetical protein VFP59_09635 [Candidatus Angelobacter sp.]|nr:hypothetical protein [Candidatus Angelobacter sp.]